ncbi:MAG TPA: gamma-glutamyltransferase [Blastocatellia bacterium]|nr:gamma-glutamyltransferase [Blastocatellia bacterium]
MRHPTGKANDSKAAALIAFLAIVSLVLSGSSLSASASDRPRWVEAIKPGRSAVRAKHGMVASSQPLASEVGLDVLKRGGNAVDAAIAMAAVLNVTEPMMTGIGGDMFALVYWSKTNELKGLNGSGKAPRALTLDHFKKNGLTRVPLEGMEPITVPGAFDGWVTLLDKYGTMKLSDLLQPAIELADNGFPVMEKTAEDWGYEVDKLKRNRAAQENYLVEGRSPRAGEIFKQKNLARTLRILAKGGRDAFYKGEVGKAIVDYCQANGGFLTMQDFAEHHSDWVQPISTDYRGYTVYEIPPNGQGLTALLTLNILEGFDLASIAAQQDRYYHTLIEATKLAFADRNRYIADPAFSKVPVAELLSKEYAASRRKLIDPEKAIEAPVPGTILNDGDTTYFTVVDKDHNAVSFINSLFEAFGSGVVAGDTGIALQDRGAGFVLDPGHPNCLAPGKRPFHTIIPAMVFKDGKLLMSFGVMGGAIQPQGHIQVLTNLFDLKMGLQQAIEAPRFRYYDHDRVLLEEDMGADVIRRLRNRGHNKSGSPGLGPVRPVMGGGQAIMIDWSTGALVGASDSRKDGMALGY